MGRSGLFAAAVLAMFASPVFAADMPLKAPPAPAPIASGWTGWYVGAEFGEKWSRSDWQPTCIDAGGPPLGSCGSATSLALFPGAPDSNASFSMHGARYGLYSGWMFQAADRWVFGAESDIAWGNKTGSVPFIVGCATAACSVGAFPPLSGDSTSLTLKGDASFRLRAGFLVLPDLQLYVAGGPALQRVQATVVCSLTGAVPCGPALSETDTKNMLGYTIGAGIEWKLMDHILLRGEYRYNDYGTWKQSAFLNSGQIEEFANIHVKSQVATFGIAYLFPPPRW